jgi:hypothetical protein
MEQKQDNLLFIGLGKGNKNLILFYFYPLNFQAGSGHNGNNENTIEETQNNTAVRKIALRDYSVKIGRLEKNTR